MDLEEIVVKLEETLELYGYTLEDLINELCECYEESEEGLDYDNEENEAITQEDKQIKMFQDRLKRITDKEDETEKKKELKELKKDLEDTYKGKGPASKQIKSLYGLIKNLLKGNKGNSKGNNRTI